MRILALDSTANTSTAAVLEDGKLLSLYTANIKNTHSETLLPMVKSVLDTLKLTVDDIDAFAVSEGPGSFTGVRIGVATVKGLAFGKEKKCVGVSTIEALAKNMEGFAGVVCPIMNARRGQVYGIVDGYLEGCPTMLADVLEIVRSQVKEDGRPVIFYGDGIDAYEPKILEELSQAFMLLEKDYFFAPVEVRYQNAAAVAKLAYEKVKEGEVLHYNDLHPDYMRKAEAEEKLAAGQLPICQLPKQE